MSRAQVRSVHFRALLAWGSLLALLLALAGGPTVQAKMPPPTKGQDILGGDGTPFEEPEYHPPTGDQQGGVAPQDPSGAITLDPQLPPVVAQPSTQPQAPAWLKLARRPLALRLMLLFHLHW
jgi:hypothetical protein